MSLFILRYDQSSTLHVSKGFLRNINIKGFFVPLPPFTDVPYKSAGRLEVSLAIVIIIIIFLFWFNIYFDL